MTTPLDAQLDKTLIVSEHVSERVRTQKIMPAQVMGDILTNILEKMSPEEQMQVEQKLNDLVGQTDEKTKNEVLHVPSPKPSL